MTITRKTELWRLQALKENVKAKHYHVTFEPLFDDPGEVGGDRQEIGCLFVDNETPYERVPQGHPTIVDYFYHEEVRGTAYSGKRNRKTD